MNYIFLIVVVAVLALVLGVAVFTNFELDNKHYDRLKWIVARWTYPVTFIGVLAKTFNIPNGVETVTVVAALGACLAGLLGVSTKNYYTNNVQTKFNTDSFTEMMDTAFEDFDDLMEDEDEDTEYLSE